MLHFRKAELRDIDLYFTWLNDPSVRKSSYHQNDIPYETHVAWFTKKIHDKKSQMLLFFNPQGIPIGQVRIEPDTAPEEAVISISIDMNFRRKGFAAKMIKEATDAFLSTNDNVNIINAKIFKENISSIKSFTEAGFKFSKHALFNGVASVVLAKKRHPSD